MSVRIITYSDLHLEFGSGWSLPAEVDGDVMILAGDIITFADFAPLHQLLRRWSKPVIYVTGNHEYYTQRPMDEDEAKFKAWLESEHPNVKLLLDSETSVEGVHFFGGTMWTNFNGGDQPAMEVARNQMADFRLIRNPDQSSFKPLDSLALHKRFVTKLMNWFAKDLAGPRVVVTHNAPVMHPQTRHVGSPLVPAFNSLDMIDVIEKHQPALWVLWPQMIGKTRIVSNQLGYPDRYLGFECKDFDDAGCPVEVVV